MGFGVSEFGVGVWSRGLGLGVQRFGVQSLRFEVDVWRVVFWDLGFGFRN